MDKPNFDFPKRTTFDTLTNIVQKHVRSVVYGGTDGFATALPALCAQFSAPLLLLAFK